MILTAAAAGIAGGHSGGLWGADAAAQPASHFSSTYAASDGSPYSDIYARAFGAGGPPAAPAASGFRIPQPGAPLVTAAPPPDVVYVIENGQLLTYNATDYANGGGTARQLSPLPAESSPLGRPIPALPSMMDRLYGRPPVETADGPADPIQLVPPQY